MFQICRREAPFAGNVGYLFKNGNAAAANLGHSRRARCSKDADNVLYGNISLKLKAISFQYWYRERLFNTSLSVHFI